MSPRRLRWLLLPGLFLLGLPAMVAPADPPSNFLWKVEGQSNAVYLLGSIHVLRPDVYPLSDAIEDAYDKSAIVTFEADVEDTPEMAMLLMQRAMFGDGRTLSGSVSADVYERLAAVATSRGLDVAMFEAFQPWFVGLMLTMGELEQAGLVEAYGIDTHFKARARDDGKALRYLETAEFQLDLFAAMSIEEQERFLRYSLDELDNTVGMLEQTFAAWLSGDYKELEALTLESLQDLPDFMQRLNGDRNRAWLPQIEAKLQLQEDALVVVGALHMVGEDGLVNLLREQGYVVTQL